MSQRIKNRLLMLLVVFTASIVLSGCSPTSLVSTQDEVDVGRQAAAQVERQYPVSRDPQLNALVNNIGLNLLQYTTPRQGIQYTFRVLDVDDVNAFSLPGGWIYINRGLIQATRGNTNQLAGVIAHEIGHIQARHHAEMMGRSTLFGIAIGTLTSGNATQWANLFANLQLLSWSRQQEYESDRLAIDYMLPSQYNPQGIIEFFRVLQTLGSNGRTPSFLRTHPLTEDRIQRAQTYLNQQRIAR